MIYAWVTAAGVDMVVKVVRSSSREVTMLKLLSRQVALRVLPPQSILHDFYPGLSAIAMRRGDVLSDWARDHARRWEDVVVVVAQLALALQHWHRVGYVHGDIKPDNVIVVKGNAASVPVTRGYCGKPLAFVPAIAESAHCQWHEAFFIDVHGAQSIQVGRDHAANLTRSDSDTESWTTPV